MPCLKWVSSKHTIFQLAYNRLGLKPNSKVLPKNLEHCTQHFHQLSIVTIADCERSNDLPLCDWGFTTCHFHTHTNQPHANLTCVTPSVLEDVDIYFSKCAPNVVNGTGVRSVVSWVCGGWAGGSTVGGAHCWNWDCSRCRGRDRGWGRSTCLQLLSSVLRISRKHCVSSAFISYVDCLGKIGMNDNCSAPQHMSMILQGSPHLTCLSCQCVGNDWILPIATNGTFANETQSFN